MASFAIGGRVTRFWSNSAPKVEKTSLLARLDSISRNWRFEPRKPA